MPAGGAITVAIPVHQPHCVAHALWSFDTMPVRYHVYGVTHTTPIPLDLPFAFCPPPDAIRNAVDR